MVQADAGHVQHASAGSAPSGSPQQATQQLSAQVQELQALLASREQQLLRHAEQMSQVQQVGSGQACSA